MKFSIIIPSYNQNMFIEKTLENVKCLKTETAKKNISIEVLLFDSCSNDKVQLILEKYRPIIDYIEIKKDSGQYDAINKGIQKVAGDYWTWLNTDDLIDINGFLKLSEILKYNPNIDYIYGSIQMIDQNDNRLKIIRSKNLTLNRLIGISAGIFQPGSFFKKEFSNKIGLLKSYECCFDYEYIVRLIKSGAQLHRCNFVVSEFRYYTLSKSGSIIIKFIEEQLIISKSYGRKTLSWLTFILNLRKLKRKLFN